LVPGMAEVSCVGSPAEEAPGPHAASTGQPALPTSPFPRRDAERQPLHPGCLR
ncbi:hypothetical protein T06_10680, partial [Trichinella sp. T6]